VRRDLHVVLTTNCLGLTVHFKKTEPQVTRLPGPKRKANTLI